jgi:hypothetical protein
MAQQNRASVREKAQSKAESAKSVNELEIGHETGDSQSHAIEGVLIKRPRRRRLNLKTDHGTANEHIKTYRDFASGLISMSEAEVRSRMLRRHSEILGSITQRELMAAVLEELIRSRQARGEGVGDLLAFDPGAPRESQP